MPSVCHGFLEHPVDHSDTLEAPDLYLSSGRRALNKNDLQRSRILQQSAEQTRQVHSQHTPSTTFTTAVHHSGAQAAVEPEPYTTAGSHEENEHSNQKLRPNHRDFYKKHPDGLPKKQKGA